MSYIKESRFYFLLVSDLIIKTFKEGAILISQFKQKNPETKN